MSYHICHVETTLLHGMPRVLRAADSAYEAGNQVTVIGFGASEMYHGYSFIGVGMPSGRRDRIIRLSSEMVRIACQSSADIVQLHAPELLLYMGALKRAGKKVIFDSHEFYSLQIMEKGYIPKYLRKVVSAAYGYFEAYSLKRVDAVLYPCTVQGRDLFAGCAKRTVKIENYSMPVPAELLPSAPADNRNVIYAGGLTEERGITTLAEAVKRTDAVLVLCGPFSSPEYQAKIMSMCQPGQIIYKGNLSREELFRQYGDVAVGMCTLHAVGQYALLDNMSTKVYEYMQCGLPVVMSNFPCYQHWNEKYHFGICVDPSDPDDIAAAIRYLLDHPDEARQMGENGRRAVKEEFNWGVEEKKLLALYEDILKN